MAHRTLLPSPPSPSSPAPVAGSALPEPAARRLRALVATTPDRLRLAGVCCLVAALAFGALGLAVTQARASALDDARVLAGRLVVLQQVHTDLVRADAEATNAFLVGGLEDPQQRAAYLDAIASASAGLTAAARSSSTPVEELDTVNVGLTRYTGLVEQARANNRQGYPIGAAYLKQASTLLRSQVLPPLQDLADRDAAKVPAAYADSLSVWAWLVGALVLAVLGWVQVWLSQLTRRTVNTGLATASAAVALALLVLVSVLASVANSLQTVRSGAFAQVVALSQARVAAFDAKANESLTLVARGSGETFEQAYRQSWQQARERLQQSAVLAVDGDGSLVTALDDWNRVHTTIRDLDDTKGQWEAAVDLATRRDAQGSAAPFTAFADESDLALADAAATVDSAVRGPVAILSRLGIALALLAAVAAAAAWRGLAARWKEYP